MTTPQKPKDIFVFQKKRMNQRGKVSSALASPSFSLASPSFPLASLLFIVHWLAYHCTSYSFNSLFVRFYALPSLLKIVSCGNLFHSLLCLTLLFLVTLY